MGRRRGERERDGDGGLGGGAVEMPGSPNRSSSAAPLPESCRARFGERERLRLEEDEWRRFFFFFFSFFWRFFSFFMAFLSAFFLRRRASSSLMDETLDELEREGMVACFAWGRRCALVQFRQRRRFRVVAHESAAVEESRLVQ